MDWALHQQQVRFDIRAERAEYDYLSSIRRECFKTDLRGLGVGTGQGKFLSRSGRESTEKKRRSGDCCIRQEF
jgi:hypothetical protein